LTADSVHELTPIELAELSWRIELTPWIWRTGDHWSFSLHLVEMQYFDVKTQVYKKSVRSANVRNFFSKILKIRKTRILALWLRNKQSTYSSRSRADRFVSPSETASDPWNTLQSPSAWAQYMQYCHATNYDRV